MIEVLSVASEVYPLVKTGGLADVVGALPAALAEQNVRVRTLVPGYRQVMAEMGGAETVAGWDDLFGGSAELKSRNIDGLEIFALDAPGLFDRAGGPYSSADGLDWPDNWSRFAALSRVAAEIATGKAGAWQPQILHAHDWQAGLAPAYLRYGPGSPVKTVVTIHNLAFQGVFGAEIFADLDLPPEARSIDGVEYYGGVGFLKAALQCADAITTVSPTYASEILTADYGMGLDGLLRLRADDLTGILNGIDNKVWDPETDPHLAEPFKPISLEGRGANKRALIERFGLDGDDGPLFGLVSRLTWQKGIDLVTGAIDQIVSDGGRLCILGNGEPGLEQALAAAAARHSGKVGLIVGYDEPLAHLMQGGADIILVPSRFEPCGLTQMFALRYGAVPLVARVGGLADSVIDANEAALGNNVATGIQFMPVAEQAFRTALNRAFDLYGQQKRWQRVQRNGMKSDFGWGASAARYKSLYESLIG